MSPCDVSEVITTSISPSWTTAVRTNSFLVEVKGFLFHKTKLSREQIWEKAMKECLKFLQPKAKNVKKIKSHFQFAQEFLWSKVREYLSTAPLRLELQPLQFDRPMAPAQIGGVDCETVFFRDFRKGHVEKTCMHVCFLVVFATDMQVP